MPASKSKIEKNLQRIREETDRACARSGRSAGEVLLVAVTKTADLDEVCSLVDLGVTELGESRVQQLIQRAAELGARLRRRSNGAAAADRLRWHMVGHLQRNKVKPVLEVCNAIHSVDSLRLAEEIDARAEQAGPGGAGRRIDVLMQVNCSQEPQKFGVAVGAAAHLAELICTLRNLRLVGLMTMAPMARNPELARPTFVRMREIFEEIRHSKTGGDDFRHLSMGMSRDYAVAVEEGATILRIGSALFE